MTALREVAFERLDPTDPADRASVLALEAESFSNPWTEDSFETMLSTPASRVFIGRGPDRQILAFCACWLFSDELHINTIAVAPRDRRRGIASALIRYILSETGARRATLEVRRSNAAALRLYEALGFKVTAIRERYYQKPPEDALILWLNP